MQIRTRYDVHKPGYVNPDPGLNFDPKKPESRSKTLQSEKDACDLNKLMARYEETGLLTDPLLGTQRKPMYGDFTGVADYHQLKIKTAAVEQAFALLPASVRNRFDNDPQKAIDFLSDPKNDEEAIKIGLKLAPPTQPKRPADADEASPTGKKEASPAPAGDAPASGGETPAQ